MSSCHLKVWKSIAKFPALKVSKILCRKPNTAIHPHLLKLLETPQLTIFFQISNQETSLPVLHPQKIFLIPHLNGPP